MVKKKLAGVIGFEPRNAGIKIQCVKPSSPHAYNIFGVPNEI